MQRSNEARPRNKPDMSLHACSNECPERIE